MLSASVLAAVTLAFGQKTNPGTRGEAYVTWGYHRNQYSTSTLHLKDQISDNYDFTLYHAKAQDRPDMHDLFHTRITVPQYVIRIGYIFDRQKNWGIEFSWDHLKYIVKDNQPMHLKGMVRGVYHDQDTLVTPKFVHFEHTNGNNYAMVSAVKRVSLLNYASGAPRLSGVVTAGAGILYPKTDSTILGNHNDGPFRYSGIVVGASAGLRYTVFKYLYIEGSLKGAFADYTNAKVYLQGRAKHHFFSIQYVYAAGLSIPI